MDKLQQASLKSALDAWRVNHNFSVHDWASATGYAYQNAWNVLRGKAEITAYTLGRFVLAYGPAALVEVYRLAGQPVSELPHPTDGQVVPVVEVQA